MRPRVFPAEDSIWSPNNLSRYSRFNEAAGIPRGRHVAHVLERLYSKFASMRPRVFPAEDG